MWNAYLADPVRDSSDPRAAPLLDTDVDLFLESRGLPPPAASAAGATLSFAWTTLLEQFLASDKQLVATGDSHVPINGACLKIRIMFKE